MEFPEQVDLFLSPTLHVQSMALVWLASSSVGRSSSTRPAAQGWADFRMHAGGSTPKSNSLKSSSRKSYCYGSTAHATPSYWQPGVVDWNEETRAGGQSFSNLYSAVSDLNEIEFDDVLTCLKKPSVHKSFKTHMANSMLRQGGIFGATGSVITYGAAYATSTEGTAASVNAFVCPDAKIDTAPVVKGQGQIPKSNIQDTAPVVKGQGQILKSNIQGADENEGTHAGGQRFSNLYSAVSDLNEIEFDDVLTCLKKPSVHKSFKTHMANSMLRQGGIFGGTGVFSCITYGASYATSTEGATASVNAFVCPDAKIDTAPAVQGQGQIPKSNIQEDWFVTENEIPHDVLVASPKE